MGPCGKGWADSGAADSGAASAGQVTRAPSAAATVSVPVPSRSACVYTSHYCEENVLCLYRDIANAAEAAGATLYVVFVSNQARQVPVWCQVLAESYNKPVLWDYHETTSSVCVREMEDSKQEMRIWFERAAGARQLDTDVHSSVATALRGRFNLSGGTVSAFCAQRFRAHVAGPSPPWQLDLRPRLYPAVSHSGKPLRDSRVSRYHLHGRQVQAGVSSCTSAGVPAAFRLQPISHAFTERAIQCSTTKSPSSKGTESNHGPQHGRVDSHGRVNW